MQKNIFYYFLGFVWQKLIFFSCNKTTQNKPNDCTPNTPLNLENLNINCKPNRV
jgi:hypothetical protein